MRICIDNSFNFSVCLCQILPGSSHHVYADRADLFNRLVNTVGRHADRDTLPPQPLQPTPKRSDPEADPVANLYNLRHDTTQGRLSDDENDDTVRLPGSVGDGSASSYRSDNASANLNHSSSGSANGSATDVARNNNYKEGNGSGSRSNSINDS